MTSAVGEFTVSLVGTRAWQQVLQFALGVGLPIRLLLLRLVNECCSFVFSAIGLKKRFRLLRGVLLV